jgi:hypothetical protein
VQRQPVRYTLVTDGFDDHEEYDDYSVHQTSYYHQPRPLPRGRPPFRYPFQGQRFQGRPLRSYHDLDAVREPQYQRQQLNYDDEDEHAAPLEYLASALQPPPNAPTAPRSMLQQNGYDGTGYKPADDEGSCFRTVIVDGILPAKPYPYDDTSNRMLRRAIMTRDAECKAISINLLDTTKLTRAKTADGIKQVPGATTAMIFFAAEEHAAHFVRDLEKQPLIIDGDECAATLLKSPTWPLSQGLKKLIGKGQTRCLEIRDLPTTVTGPQLMDILLSAYPNMSYDNFHDLQRDDTGVVRVTFDSLRSADWADCSIKGSEMLRKWCRATFWPRPALNAPRESHESGGFSSSEQAEKEASPSQSSGVDDLHATSEADEVVDACKKSAKCGMLLPPGETLVVRPPVECQIKYKENNEVTSRITAGVSSRSELSDHDEEEVLTGYQQQKGRGLAAFDSDSSDKGDVEISRSDSTLHKALAAMCFKSPERDGLRSSRWASDEPLIPGPTWEQQRGPQMKPMFGVLGDRDCPRNPDEIELDY